MTITPESPVSDLKKALDKVFGAIPWWTYEVETILLENGIPVSDLGREKINLLKVSLTHRDAFYTDYLFFLHAVEVFNNNITDFQYIPSPTSLEMAFAIVDMAKTFEHPIEESPLFSDEVRLTIKNTLVNEGYSVPVGPFSNVGITGLTPGQTPQDTNNKLKAITQYVSSIYSKSTS
jgi:hypothetical protein